MNKIFLLVLIIIFASCSKVKENNEKISDVFQADIIKLNQELVEFQNVIDKDAPIDKIRSQFLKTHAAYKRVELLTEYYFPSVAKALNGPALPEFEQNDGKTLPPEGFQVIEEIIFTDDNQYAKSNLKNQIGILSANLIRLKAIAKNNQLTNSHVFDAMQIEVVRVITLGITGFDTPISKNALVETKVALETVKDYYSFYADNQKGKVFTNTLNLLDQATKYLSENNDFDTFDRAHFILKYLNPLSKNIFKSQQLLKIPFFDENRPLRVLTQSIFDKNAFDVEGFSAFPDYITTPSKISLGKSLFYDKILSGNNSRSCASCHHPDKAFTDGMVSAQTLDGKSLIKRNTPTLSNIAFQRSFFYDSRVSYIEDQAVAVIQNKNEMHGSLSLAAKNLSQDPKYIEMFKIAFPKNPINEFSIKNALASYIRSLSNYNAKFDQYMQGKVNFNKDEIAGFNLFTGKAKCATCHFIPLTNGTVPPFFDKSESEVLGVPNASGKLDTDKGKFDYTKADIHLFSFKTPTLRNVALTAPYMHNGVFKSLDEVVEFYNKGGGAGLGFELNNQTLPSDKLNLSATEKAQLIAFIKTLTDIR